MACATSHTSSGAQLLVDRQSALKINTKPPPWVLDWDLDWDLVWDLVWDLIPGPVCPSVPGSTIMRLRFTGADLPLGPGHRNGFTPASLTLPLPLPLSLSLSLLLPHPSANKSPSEGKEGGKPGGRLVSVLPVGVSLPRDAVPQICVESSTDVLVLGAERFSSLPWRRWCRVSQLMLTQMRGCCRPTVPAVYTLRRMRPKRARVIPSTGGGAPRRARGVAKLLSVFPVLRWPTGGHYWPRRGRS